jgi:hypothetical protein
MKEKIKISHRGFITIYRAIENAIVFTKIGETQLKFVKSYNYLQSAKFINAHMTINPFTKRKI